LHPNLPITPEEKVSNGKIYQTFFVNLHASNITLRTAQPNLPIAHEDEGGDAVECDHAEVSNCQID
jgi:hypothetical protein